MKKIKKSNLLMTQHLLINLQKSHQNIYIQANYVEQRINFNENIEKKAQEKLVTSS
mgnify:CR=1 FL=1